MIQILLVTNNLLPIFDSEMEKNIHFNTADYMPGYSIDAVIIGYKDEKLHILVLKWKEIDYWLLPGGFIKKSEDLENAAKRILYERTGIKLPFLDQFYTFGKHNRNKPYIRKKMIDQVHHFTPEIESWLNNRFITTGYLALVDIDACKPKSDFLSDTCVWKAVEEIPTLALDHRDIMLKALEHLKVRLNYLPVGRSLLPEKFTIPELQKLYEAILGKNLDRGNFQRKILKLGILIRLEKKKTGGAHKAPYLYKFDRIKYESLLNTGVGFFM